MTRGRPSPSTFRVAHGLLPIPIFALSEWPDEALA
jgi:hypothetical protein